MSKLLLTLTTTFFFATMYVTTMVAYSRGSLPSMFNSAIEALPDSLVPLLDTGQRSPLKILSDELSSGQDPRDLLDFYRSVGVEGEIPDIFKVSCTGAVPKSDLDRLMYEPTNTLDAIYLGTGDIEIALLMAKQHQDVLDKRLLYRDLVEKAAGRSGMYRSAAIDICPMITYGGAVRAAYDYGYRDDYEDFDVKSSFVSSLKKEKNRDVQRFLKVLGLI